MCFERDTNTARSCAGSCNRCRQLRCAPRNASIHAGCEGFCGATVFVPRMFQLGDAFQFG